MMLSKNWLKRFNKTFGDTSFLKLSKMRHYIRGVLTLSAPNLQNGQTHPNNSPAVADELFECVWPFCGIGA